MRPVKIAHQKPLIRSSSIIEPFYCDLLLTPLRNASLGPLQSKLAMSNEPSTHPVLLRIRLG